MAKFSFKKKNTIFDDLLNFDEEAHKEKVKYLDVFKNTSDVGFLSFVIEQWGYNPQFYYGKDLKQVNPKLHHNITKHLFFEEFKIHIQLQHIAEIKQVFYEFEDPKSELKYFNELLKDFKSNIATNLQKQEITSFSRKYIDEVSLQLTQLREQLYKKFYTRPENYKTQSKKVANEDVFTVKGTVFGKNFNFIERLYDELWAKYFLDDTTNKEEFLNHFYISKIPDIKITLTGKNSADLGLLIKSLKIFFIEDYQEPSFFNQFWAERFLFSTNRKKNFSKDDTGISKMISSINRDRQPQKKTSIKEIVENLKAILR